MSNGLASFGFDMTTGSSRSFTVDHQSCPDGPSPLLHPHYRASSLLRDGPPLCSASVLCPLPFLRLGVLPLVTGGTLRVQ